MPLLVPAEVGSILRPFSGEMKLAAERQRPEMGWGAGLQHHPLTRGSQTPPLLLSTGTSPDLQDSRGVTSAPTGHSTQLSRCGVRVLSSKDAPSAYSILKTSAISLQSRQTQKGKAPRNPFLSAEFTADGAHWRPSWLCARLPL